MLFFWVVISSGLVRRHQHSWKAWRWKQYVPPRRWYLRTTSFWSTTQNNVVNFFVVRALNTQLYFSSLYRVIQKSLWNCKNVRVLRAHLPQHNWLKEGSGQSNTVKWHIHSRHLGIGCAQGLLNHPVVSEVWPPCTERRSTLQVFKQSDSDNILVQVSCSGQLGDNTGILQFIQLTFYWRMSEIRGGDWTCRSEGGNKKWTANFDGELLG
jgi:hypothetical protein